MSITSSFLRLAALPAVGLLVASALAVSVADGQTGRTLRFTGPAAHDPREAKQIDVRPRGLSIGDHYVVAGSLRADGRVVARAHANCTIIDRSYEGQDCDFVIVFADGTVTASGGGLHRRLPGQPPSPPQRPRRVRHHRRHRRLPQRLGNPLTAKPRQPADAHPHPLT